MFYRPVVHVLKNKLICKVTWMQSYIGQQKRHLLSWDLLGVENFKRQKLIMSGTVEPVKESFLNRLESHISQSETNPIYTEDMKTMISVASDDREVDLVTRMVYKYYKQRSGIGLGSSFVFGPPLMRMCYVLDKPDLAYILFTDQRLEGVFNQTSSVVVLMDLMFEKGDYEKVAEVMKVAKERNLGNNPYPSNCLTLACASFLKQNTHESYDKMINLIDEWRKIGQETKKLPQRCAAYCVMLALKQNNPNKALEILNLSSLNGNNGSLLLLNCKLLTMLKLQNYEEVLTILKDYLEIDVPDHIQRGHEFYSEMTDALKKTVELTDDATLGYEIKNVLNMLKDGNYLSDLSLESTLFYPIIAKRGYQDSRKKLRLKRGTWN